MKTVSLIAIALLLGGCATRMEQPERQAPIQVGAGAAQKLVLNLSGSQTATSADDWESLKGIWRDAFSKQAKQANVAYAFQEGDARHTGEDGTLLAVYVNDYRIVSTGARFGFGVMTGNAFVDSSVEFIDLKNGTTWGKRPYNTKSSAWEGVFSAMTAKQVDAICKALVDTTLGR